MPAGDGGTGAASSGASGPTATLDLRGLNCPLPVLRTRKRLKGMAPGARLVVETSDPLAAIDIPAFLNEDGQRLISSERTPDGHRFLIERA